MGRGGLPSPLFMSSTHLSFSHAHAGILLKTMCMRMATIKTRSSLLAASNGWCAGSLPSGVNRNSYGLLPPPSGSHLVLGGVYEMLWSSEYRP